MRTEKNHLFIDEHECRKMERIKKTYEKIGCEGQDIRDMDMSEEMTTDRGKWKKKTDPK
jgi:hypothetical protein